MGFDVVDLAQQLQRADSVDGARRSRDGDDDPFHAGRPHACGTITMGLLATSIHESMGHRTVPFQDFREFLDALRARGELIDVDRPVALDLEVAKALRKSASTGGPAVVFTDNGT